MSARTESRDKAISVLSWLIPITYLIHIAEEWWGGEGYPAYISRLGGAHMPETRFLVAQVIGFALVILGIVLARRFGFSAMMIIILATTVMINGFTHAYSAIDELSYNPGLLSSVLIWIPIGVWVLIQFRQLVSWQRYIIAIAIGAGINVVIAVLTMRGLH